MKKLVIVFLILCFPTYLVADDFSWWGTAPPDSISMGSFVWHLSTISHPEREKRYHLMYPYIGVTYHSASLLYFKNSFERSTVGLMMDRELGKKPLSENLSLDFGYGFGALFGGYCIKDLTCKTPSARIVPIAALITGITYKNRFGFDVSLFGAVITGTFRYNF